MSTDSPNRTEATPWPTELTDEQKSFLDAFAEQGSVIAACKGICHRLSHFHWFDASDVYRQAFRLARALFGERLREIALCRAIQGVEEQVFYKGQLQRDEKGAVVTRRRFYPALLKMFIQWMAQPWNEEITRRSGSNPTLRNTLTQLISDRERMAAAPQPNPKKAPNATSWKKIRQSMMQTAIA